VCVLKCSMHVCMFVYFDMFGMRHAATFDMFGMRHAAT